MEILDNKEVCGITEVDDATDFLEFQRTGEFNLAMVPEPYFGDDELLMKPNATDFAKWLHIHEPDIKVQLRQTNRRLLLKSADYWLPLVYLASDMTVVDYLMMVVRYIYDQARGRLAGEQPRVHLDVVYQDEKNGVTKRLHYEGDAETLKSKIKEFDCNKFMDK